MKYITVTLPIGVFNVEIKRKNIKNVHLKVYRDMTASLSVPLNTPYEWAESFVLSKKNWLNKQFLKFKESCGYNNLDSLKSGSSTRMLGKDLRIFMVQDNKELIEINEKSVIMHVKNIENEKHNNLLFEKWWVEQAFYIYNNLVDKLMPIFARHNIKKPTIIIRKMKTLWGSCNKQKCKITFNEYLLKADVRCIEYVVLHELTHLIYNGHGKDFYDFLTIYMPDWKDRKKQLDTEVVQGL